MDNKAKVGVLDYLLVFAKWSRTIILSFLIACVLAFIIGSIVPKWYRATAVVYPPQEDILNFGLSNLVQNLPFGGFGLSGESQQTLIYMAILQSRTIMETIADRFDLVALYKARNMEHTIRLLRAKVDFNIEKEGTISVSVLDQNPRRASNMANAFVSYLDSLNTIKEVETARNNRIFIEKEYNDCITDLSDAEDALKAFQERFGVLSLPDQIEQEIKNVSNLYAEIITAEIDLRVKERSLTAGHSIVRDAQIKLRELKRKLDELVSKASSDSQSFGNGNTPSTELFIPIKQLPELSVSYARLYRDVQVKSKIYELLSQMYEQAKIQEAKDTPRVQILDPAIPPIHKAKPKRLIWMLIAGSLSLIVVVVYAFSVEYLQRKEAEDDAEVDKINLIKSHLRESFRFRRKNQ